jgi:predicted permease
MKRAPMLSLTAILTIALSTAALATVLTLGYTLFFRRLPVDRPQELVAVAATRLRSDPEGVAVREANRLRVLGRVSYADYLAFRDRTTTLAGLAAHYPTAPLFVSANGNVKEVNGAVVSANFFPLLGIQPALGRFFHDNEDRVPDRDRVAVIGHDFWRTWFASSPAAIGSSMRINGTDFTIVGVAPSTFAGMTSSPMEVYIPTMMLRVGYRWCADALASDCTVLQMIGRLARGRTATDAAAELPALMPASWFHAPLGENSGVAVTEARGFSTDDEEPRLVGILAGMALVLLAVCCANLAGLSSAQSAARAAEFAIRVSLGAGSRRIIRQVATEWLMLAVAGGIAGLVLSRGFMGVLAQTFYAMDDEGHPLHYDFGQTPIIVFATIAAAVAAGLVISIVPAITVVRRPGAGRVAQRWTTTRWSAGAWLLGAQAAVAVATVAVAGLLAASARTMLAGRNYDASHVALMRVRPRLVKYTPERAQRFQRELVQQLATVPSVESVSMVGIGTVLDGASIGVALPQWTGEQRVRARYNEIGPRYFATLRTPVLSGREFDDRDSVQSPRVAVVNQSMAARLWPDGTALGATLLVKGTRHVVVGVVKDQRLERRTEAAEPWVYAPFWQNPAQVDSRLAVRIAGDPAAMLPALVREVNRIDPDVPIAETITLPIRMAALTRQLRVSAAFVGYTATLAVLLTAVGLYGSLAFAVSRRTKEIGVRMALGAARGRIVGSIVRDGLSVILAGVAAGVALAVAGTRLVTHLLYGSADADWVFYAAAAILVGVVGLVASVLPARRAAGIEPLVALRCD